MIYVAFLCDGHGMGTPGKETPHISSLGRKIKENEFNRAVVKQLKVLLERHGISCYEVAPTDVDTPLKARTDYANNTLATLQKKHGKNNVNAIYVSVHYDAFDGKFNSYDPEGITVFVYPGNLKMNSGKLAHAVLKFLVQGTPQKSRGVKESNLHVLRETNMPAILTENGFMDNMREALLMINPDFQREVAVEHAKGICEYFNIKYVDEKKEVLKVEPKKDYEGHWAEKYINEAIENKEMTGSSPEKFRPNDPLTRAEMTVILHNLRKK